MNAPRQPSRKEARGFILPTALVFAAILAITIATYLAWVTYEYRLEQRSDMWTQALYLAEAGLELGCAELNFPYRYGGLAFSTADGWTPVGADAYQRTVTNFLDSTGKDIGSFSVTVSAVRSPTPVIQAVGTPTASHGPTTRRAIQLWLKKRSSYTSAIVARRQLTMNGGSSVDSFDSSDPYKSTDGSYDPAKRQANAGIASASTNAQAILAETVYGTAATGPGGTMLLSGSIGPTFDSSQRATTTAAAESEGWLTHDFVLEVHDVTLPAGLGSAYHLGAVKSGITLTSGDWQADSLNSSTSDKAIVIDGHVRLYVSGDVKITGGGSIEITTGGSLELYVGGDVSVTGNGVVNRNGLAQYNVWYGLPSSTTWAVSGNGAWVGVMYAPQASASFSGSGGTTGAFVANNITITGGSGLHYDEALAGKGGGNRGYTVSVWQELRQSGGSWVP